MIRRWIKLVYVFMELFLKDEVYSIIGAAMEVHRTLGAGFLEAVYQEALTIELKSRTIPFVKEKKLEIAYKDIPLEKYYVADFLCYDSIIVELKALSYITNDHKAQVINYLKSTGLKVGVILNFGASSLEYKRIVY